jgi:hypothetical protein
MLTGSPLNISDLDTLSQKRVYLHPYLHELISRRSAWTKPTPQKEPYTYRMLSSCTLQGYYVRFPK